MEKCSFFVIFSIFHELLALLGQGVTLDTESNNCVINKNNSKPLELLKMTMIYTFWTVLCNLQ